MRAIDCGFLAVLFMVRTASAAGDDPKLVAEAKVGETEARASALARVPGGKVKSEELEREKGHLIWSYDIEVPGRSGVEEVNVDALTGKVLGVKHESAKDEGKEAKTEHAESAKTKPRPRPSPSGD